MTQITVEVPDSKHDSFLDKMDELGLKTNADGPEISATVKREVRTRRDHAHRHPEKLITRRELEKRISNK